MDDLENLELLSLVSKISSELQNHLGISDKTLAEFIIAQHEESKSLDEFKQNFEALYDGVPQSLVESIDRLILTLHPKYKRKAKENGPKSTPVADDEKSKKTRLFKGLAIPDQEPSWDNGGIGDLQLKFDDTKVDGMDDTFAMLETMAGKAKPKSRENGTSRKRSISPSYGDRRHRDSKRRRSRSRSRGRNDKYTFEDDYDRRRGSRKSGENLNGGRRQRSISEDRRRTPEPELDDTPVLYKVYSGTVTGVKDFGVFVRLHNIKGRMDGLVHISAMQEGARVNHPSDLVSRNQQVFVKVMKYENNRLSLSMKEVDQETGQDLAPEKRLGTGANMMGLRGVDGNSRSHVPVIEDDFDSRGRSQRKRMTTPERWEIKQLIASGAISRDTYPDIDEFDNAAVNEKGEFEEEEDVDIEMTEQEPPFLKGQTAQSLELSPIRIVKAESGSLYRAAMSGESLAKERRDLKQQEAQAKADQRAAEVDLSSQWHDPMATQRNFASDLRSQPAIEPMPEWKRIATGKEQSYGPRTNLSIKEQRESLPIFKLRKQLLEAIRANRILIVIGDTGSGKTTQLTQYLAEDGYANELMIGCTQPRRVAAMSVAKRVSEEVGCRLGEEVGYTIRFEDCTSSSTRIKYMTDGILQREILLDPLLQKYKVVMLDEAHERTIATDVLFGLLKKTLTKRPDMKLIVTSATLDADKFSAYFNQCPIFTIPGRTYPVEIMYSKEPESDYLDAALVTAMQIHLAEPAGDILLFLTGKEEIDTSCEILHERMKALGPNVPELVILPIYGALPSEIASRIFEPAPPGARKIILATNIAETSLTLDGVYYVIDPGFSKQIAYDAKLGMDRLQVAPISQQSAKQRAGRAGRTGPGKCFRLYTESAFQSEMLETTIPEIQRTNLSNTILMLKAMGINDLLRFDFMDPPPTNTMLEAMETLYALQALDDEGLLTRLGRRMADFPMDPSLAKALLASAQMGCAEEMLTIVAMISATQSVFHRPKEKQKQADDKKAKFNDQHGDHLTLLNVYNAWRDSNFSTPWAYENFIMPKAMKRVQDVRKQLVQIFQRHKLPVISCGRNTMKVRQALCSGFFKNSARKSQEGNYATLVEGTPVYMHPASALFGKPAEFVVYHSLVETTKEYMHVCTSIEPKWLVETAPTFFKVAPTDKLSKRKKAERIQPLHNKYAGEDDWRLSAQRRQGRGGGGTFG